MMITDLEGNILGICKGIANNVTPTERMLEILKSSSSKTINVTHNHRSSSSFSIEDLVMANSTESIKTLTIVGHNGRVYSLSIPKGKHIADNDMNKFTDVYYTNFINETVKTNRKSKLSAIEKFTIVQDRTIKKVAKYFGWIYRS